MLFNNKNLYQNLGYRFNPFEGLTKEEFQSAFPPSNFVKKILDEEFEILQIVGGCGFGKTSLILQIYRFLLEKGESVQYHYTQNTEKTLNPSDFFSQTIILDETQRLSIKFFNLFANKCQSENKRLILGSHMDFENCLNPPRRLKTIYLSQYFNERLPEILSQRLNCAAIDSPRHQFSTEAVKTLARLCQHSFEIARSICYELFLDPDIPASITSQNIKRAAKITFNNSSRVIRNP